MKENHYRLETIYTLLAPLSHIGESISTQGTFNKTTILVDGKPERVPFYTGNALRGMWRDCGAIYLLDKLGIKVPLKTFHLLTSGGSIGGEQSVDIDQARMLRKAVPLLSIFGGGVGNQILDGKIKQTPAYLICKETNHILPDYVQKSDVSWRQQIETLEFTRKDDEKNEKLRENYLLQEGEEVVLLEGEVTKETKKRKEKDGPNTQMRFGVDCLVTGAKLFHRMDIICTEVELGAFVSCLHEWQKAPYIGGKAGAGFGLVAAEFTLCQGGKREPFALIDSTCLKLGEVAEKSKTAYDQHLEQYVTYLEEKQTDLIRLLEGAKK